MLEIVFDYCSPMIKHPLRQIDKLRQIVVNTFNHCFLMQFTFCVDVTFQEKYSTFPVWIFVASGGLLITWKVIASLSSAEIFK